jgi:hypothetical protein
VLVCVWGWQTGKVSVQMSLVQFVLIAEKQINDMGSQNFCYNFELFDISSLYLRSVLSTLIDRPLGTS